MQSIKRAPATEGPLFSKMLLFALPIMLTGILQLLYNSADSIVVGRFSGDPNALGAVGCTASTTGLLINMLMGLGAGTSVLVSQFFGAKNSSGISRTVHTSISAGLIGGVLIAVLGELLAEPLLALLGTKPDLFDSALLYVKIIFLGVPGLAVFNFGAAIVRSLGDSKTPLIILASTGFLNVVLNLFFVISCSLSVVGVALATIISQYASAAAIILVLMRADGPQKLSLRKTGIDFSILIRMLKIAIPSALQSSLFSISNMIVQSSVNTFPTATVSGNAVALSVEGFAYTALSSFYTVTLTFVGQNYGAKKFKRTARVLFYSLIQVSFIGLLIGSVMRCFAEQLSAVFVDTAAANSELIIAASVERLNILLIPYFLCGCMEIFTGFLRGWGYSLLPMITTVFCVCVVRVLWARFIFPLDAFNTLAGLCVIIPISWLLAVLLQGIMSLTVYLKNKEKEGV